MGRRVARLTRNLDHRSTFREEQRHERMPEVIRSEVSESGCARSRGEHALAPVAPVLFCPDAVVARREHEHVL
jgi:hypothetical protein